MKRFFQSEAGAAVLWVVSSIVMGAVIAPWLYQGGKAFSAAAEKKDFPVILEWLGAACGRAGFSRYYGRALVASAIILLPFLFSRIRGLRALDGGTVDSWVWISWRMRVIQISAGFLIAGGMLWMLGVILEAFGAYAIKPNSMLLGKVLEKTIGPVVVVSLLEEWLFRGILLGLWLKFSKPMAACVGTSLYFAFVHFLRLPEGAVIGNPASLLAGFELLGKILLHFSNPQFFITDFATLFIIGIILAWARVRTGALWFSIGLHAGWIMAFKSYNLLYRSVSNHPLHSWGVGETLRSGLLPLLTLGLTAVICHFVWRACEAGRSVS